jgi:hypothetical protein
MSQVYYIRERKPVVYTYKVFAKSKAEALRKFNSHGDYEEIGLDPGSGKVTITVTDMGPASDKCAECGADYRPENVRDYLCRECRSGG